MLTAARLGALLDATEPQTVQKVSETPPDDTNLWIRFSPDTSRYFCPNMNRAKARQFAANAHILQCQ